MQHLSVPIHRLKAAAVAAILAALIATTMMLTASGNAVTAQNNNDPDSTRAGAVSLGDITAQHRAKGKNHPIDGVNDVTDYFSFSLTATREVMVKLKEMERNADLFIEDQDGNELASSTEAGTADEAIFHELDAGTYYIRVKAMQRGSNIYKLRYKATEPVQEDDDPTPANSAATGAPTISGTPERGQTLSADTSGVGDQNGLTNPGFTYQWLRDDSAIPGATDQEYTLTAADVGSAIKVQVNFVDDDGYQESLTSAATDAVTRPANVAATGQPTITGTEQVGNVLTADASGIADENGLENARFAYQWIRNDGNADSEISGETGSNYTLTTADLSHTIKVKVSFTDDDGYEETATSAATGTVSRPADAEPTGLPTITGTAEVGETLTADTSGIADANGLSNPGFTYQWVRSGANPDAQITGATGANYTALDQDAGNSLKVTVSFTDDHGYAHSLTSSPTPPVGAGTGTGPGLTPSFLHNDDCTGDTATTCILTLGGHFDGNIHNPGSRQYEEDWVKLEDLTSGRYKFRLTGRGSNPSPALTMIIRKEGRSPGTVAYGTHIHHFVAGNDAGLAGSPTDVYIEVRGENGDYRLSVERLSYIEPSGADLASGATTAGWLEVGYDPHPGKSGNVAYQGDQDGFKVDLEAGKNYRIDVKGNERTDYGGTAPDTILSLTMPTAESGTLLNPIPDVVYHIAPGGVPSQAMIATGGGRGANARLDIRVNTSGEFLIVASDANSTGTYTVVVNVLTTRETLSERSGTDFPGDTSTIGYIQINGASATGDLNPSTSEDWYQVDFVAGRVYRIDLKGVEPRDPGGTLCDPSLELRGQNGEQLTSTTDVTALVADVTALLGQDTAGIVDWDNGVGDNAGIEIEIHTSGSYYIVVGSQCGAEPGTYTLFARQETLQRPLTTYPPRGSKQTVSEGTGQDLPNFLTSAGHVQVNGDGATGNIANTGDQDVFAVRLEGNTQYRIEVWGEDPDQDGGSLADPKFTVRNPAFDRTTNGSEIEHIGFETWEQFSRGGVKDNDSGSGKNASVDVAPNWPGRTFYIQVSGHDGSTGTYTVFVTEIGKDRWRTPTPMVQGLPPGSSYFPTVSEPKGQDFPNDTTTQGWIKPDGSRAHGELEDFSDIDYFKAKLVAGYSYRIDMKGSNSAEPGGTLQNPTVRLKDQNGNDIPATSDIATPTLCDSCSGQPRIADDNSGAGDNARIEVDIKETQTYHIQADTGSNLGGTYTVQITVLGRHDG